MSLFERRAASLSGQSGVLTELLALRGTGPRGVSLHVTPDTAMRHSAVAACVQLIANLAMLDVNAYRLVDGRQVVADLQPSILTNPSVDVDAFEWRRQVLLSWLTRGTAFGYVAASDRFGFPSQIELLPAAMVSVDGRGPFGPWVWRVGGETIERWPDGPLWVARGLHSLPGCPVGVSPIEMALGAIGLGLAAENFGESWFADGAHPSAILTTDQPVSAEVAAAVKSRFLEAVRGRREPAVMGAGIKYQSIQVAADESQFLETLDRNVATVCRFFLVPPSEVGGTTGDSMTYSNAEARSLALLTRTFQPWITRLEYVLTALTPRPFMARAEISGLLRTDLRTRTDVDVLDIRAGIRSRDEIRATRGLGPTVGGDLYSWPPFGTAAPIAPIEQMEQKL